MQISQNSFRDASRLDSKTIQSTENQYIKNI